MRHSMRGYGSYQASLPIQEDITYYNRIQEAEHEARDAYPASDFLLSHSKLLRFETPETYADYVKTIPEEYDYLNGFDLEYSGDGLTWHQAIEKLYIGDTSKAEEAEKVMDKLSEDQVFSEGMPSPSLDITGALTHWQNYEAGLPNCMITRRMSDLKGANAPLTIYYDRFGSVGLSSQHLINRGVACLAFVMAMSKIRPINLYVLSVTSPGSPASLFPEGSLYGSIIRIDTQPLDLSRAAWILTSPTFTRRMTWNSASYLCAQHLKLSKQHRSAYGPFVGTPADGESYKQSMRHAFGLQPDDILLLGASSLDRLATSNPVEWVKQMIHKHIHGIDEERLDNRE